MAPTLLSGRKLNKNTFHWQHLFLLDLINFVIMKIAVDIGNTRTKVAYYDEHNQMTFEVVADIKTFKKRFTQHFTNGIISSVQNEVSIEAWQQAFPDVRWHILSAQSAVPFRNAYQTPQTLGLDRIALVAAAAHYFAGQHTLVIDAGTCVTYDFIRADGTYLGGAISPGLTMRLKAMHHFTAKLPEVQRLETCDLIGSSTTTCMQSGALHGLVAELSGTIAAYESRFRSVQIVLTGGDMKTLASLMKNNIFARPKFLLEGLHVILASNTL